jgi:hypothetical protein
MGMFIKLVADLEHGSLEQMGKRGRSRPLDFAPNRG